MCHEVEEYIDPERIGALFGELVEEVSVLAFALPTIPIVRIVSGDDHDVPLVIEDGAHMHLLALLAVMVLPRHAGVLAALAEHEVGRLKSVLIRPQVEHTMKNRVIHSDFSKGLIGEHPL